MNTKAKNKNPVISLDGVSKWYGDFQALKDINLEINLKEKIVICGPSGSGKSTLIRCLNRLEAHQEGKIHVSGVELHETMKDVDIVRRDIGMVFQNFNLFPHMTALENAMLAPRRVRKLSKSQLQPEIENLFERFELADRMHNYPDQLSGGQQQRVAIVRALAMKPEVMLFDEITSALDPQLVGEVLDVLLQLKSQGMTMVLATHEMQFARQAADKVCFLKNGKIIEEGPPDQIFEAPKQVETQNFLARPLK